MDKMECYRILEFGFLREAKDLLENESRKLYTKLCTEFGVETPWSLNVGIHKKYAGHNAESRIYTERTSQNFAVIDYFLGHVRVLPSRTMDTLLPHEVAHVFCATIFPHTLVDGYHGEEWEEIMEYLGQEPSQYANLGSYTASMVATYQEKNDV